MKFFVNFLSAFRIAASFAIILTLMLQMYWTTFILFVLAAASDWFDGYLARKYNVCTKIGGVMDHIGDKLLVVNTLIMLCVMMPVWFVIVPVIIMIARELYISGLREFLGTQKIEMPVPKARFSMGKIKTTFQMISISAFLLIFVIGTMITPESDSRAFIWLIYLLPQIGTWGLWISLLASVWSATQYTMTFLGHMKTLNKKKK
ncbi:MAG: CDP-alcohol phosphatidyltransferase family protein [Alphaproteobacteria bacterium]|nr:CDP-alcohol phosphatidyltransferase family protein [Alphaproteobacteria bacterium]